VEVVVVPLVLVETQLLALQVLVALEHLFILHGELQRVLVTM
jgi:hypothetical protein